MNCNSEILIDKFKEIAKKRWIPSVNNNSNGVGLTFEKLLNKSPDSMFFPDYQGIENSEDVWLNVEISSVPIKVQCA